MTFVSYAYRNAVRPCLHWLNFRILQVFGLKILCIFIEIVEQIDLWAHNCTMQVFLQLKFFDFCWNIYLIKFELIAKTTFIINNSNTYQITLENSILVEKYYSGQFIYKSRSDKSSKQNESMLVIANFFGYDLM